MLHLLALNKEEVVVQILFLIALHLLEAVEVVLIFLHKITLLEMVCLVALAEAVVLLKAQILELAMDTQAELEHLDKDTLELMLLMLVAEAEELVVQARLDLVVLLEEMLEMAELVNHHQ